VSSLNGSMVDGTLVKPVPPNQAAQEDPDAPANAAIGDAYGQLGTFLKGMPDIDYAAKFQPMIDQAQKRETTKMPSGLAMFAAALGAPREAPRVLASRWEQMNNEQGQKDRDLLSLQHAIMQGEVSQEIEKGNFAKALKQSEVLGKLQNTLGRIEREALMKEWEAKQKILNTDRASLLRQKGDQAKNLLKDKVKELVTSFHLPEKQALLLQAQAGGLLTALLGKQDMMSGDPSFTPTEAQSMVDQVLPDLTQMAEAAARAAAEPTAVTVKVDGGTHAARLAAIRANAKTNK
jgi:hypothetical protein